MAEDTKRGVIVNRMGAFVAIPMAFVNDTRITNAGRCLYMLLSSYTSAKADEAIAFPSYATIMKRLDWKSQHTVADALVNLLVTGWVGRKRRYSSSSLYTINYAPDASSAETAQATEMQKLHDQKCRKRTTDSAKSAHQPEVPRKQEGDYQEVEGAARKKRVAGFASVYTTHDDPRVSAFLEILARKQITATDADIIQKRVKTETLDIWRDALAIFAAEPNWRIDLANIFDRYERTVNAKRFPKQNSATKIGEWTPAKGMYPQVPDKPQPAPAPRRATMFGIEVDTVDHSNTTEVPF